MKAPALLPPILRLIANATALFALAGVFAPGVVIRPAYAETQAQEEAIGAKEVAEVEKSVKLDTNPADVNRVATIGAKIAAIADTVKVPAGFGNDTVYPFKYTYKVIDDKTINAFSIPGGHIYIYKGLLDLLKTDDELAAVLGHETAHAAHHHVVTLSHEANKLDTEYMIGVLAAILAHDGDLGGDMAVGQLAAEAQLNNHFSVQAEKDADHTGMIYMQKAGYNPIGMLSMLQRLENVEKMEPAIDMGYLQDHPLTPERITAAVSELKQLGVSVNTQEYRLASGAITASVKAVNAAGQAPAGVQLLLGDQVICTLPPAGQTAEQSAASTLNQLLDQNLQMYEVRSDGQSLIARDQVLLTFQSPATLPAGTDGAALAKSAADAIKNALWQQQVNGNNYVPPSTDASANGGGAGGF